MKHKSVKILGIMWLLLAVLIAVTFVFGISPLVKLIPWSFEKKLSKATDFNFEDRTCHPSVQEESVLNKLVQRIYPLDADDKKKDISVDIMDDTTINAFAQLGGRITINSGLLQEATSAEEVAAVLAHEIEHVRSRHILENFLVNLMTLEGVKLIFSGRLISNAKWTNLFLHMGFSRYQESQADEKALQRLQLAQVDNQGFKNFFKRMSQLAYVPEIISDHPSHQSRLRMINDFPNKDVKPILTPEEWKALKDYCQ